MKNGSVIHGCGEPLRYDPQTETWICKRCGNITEQVESATIEPQFMIQDEGGATAETGDAGAPLVKVDDNMTCATVGMIFAQSDKTYVATTMAAIKRAYPNIEILQDDEKYDACSTR